MARDQQRRIRGEQDIIVRYEPARALETLPLLLAKPADRARLRALAGPPARRQTPGRIQADTRAARHCSKQIRAAPRSKKPPGTGCLSPEENMQTRTLTRRPATSLERNESMESLTNVTFSEIKVGDTASVSRRLSTAEVEALALAGGDVDAFQIAEGQPPRPGQAQTESVGAEALLLGLLNRKLPGPGTSITAQDLHFTGRVQTGDELVATVTARKKRAKDKLGRVRLLRALRRPRPGHRHRHRARPGTAPPLRRRGHAQGDSPPHRQVRRCS